jgi:hypothetical protein
MDQDLEIAGPATPKRPEGVVVGVVPGGEHGDAKRSKAREHLSGPGDPSEPPEDKRRMDPTSRTRGVDLGGHVPSGDLGQLEAPGLRVAGDLDGHLGPGQRAGVRAHVEPEMAGDLLPLVGAGGAGLPECSPGAVRSFHPVDGGLGKDEQQGQDGANHP